MKNKIKYFLMHTAILGVYVIGITTVTATSRYTGYQPKEDDALIEAVRKAKGE